MLELKVGNSDRAKSFNKMSDLQRILSSLELSDALRVVAIVFSYVSATASYRSFSPGIDYSGCQKIQ